MRTLSIMLAVILCSLLNSNSTTAQVAPKVDKLIGTYLASDAEASNNQSHIKIFKSTNGKYYGEIVWLKVPNYPDGKEKVDRLNPDEKLRSRKILGMKLLNNFKYDEKAGEWNGGTIYNPASGKTYNAYITLLGNDKLHIRGFIGKSWMGLGKTVEWTRIK